MVTATGTLLLVVVPLPSWPMNPHPQQYAVPIVVKAQVDEPLASIALNNTPLGMLTATGNVASGVCAVAELALTIISPAVRSLRRS